MTDQMTDVSLQNMFEFIRMYDPENKATLANVDMMKNPEKQRKLFKETCDTARKLQSDNKILIMTTLPADRRDGPDASKLIKEWLYIPEHDVMLYFLSNGHRKVTGEQGNIDKVMKVLEANSTRRGSKQSK
jgi:hypothetical protein